MSDIYNRLAEIGFDRKFVKEHVLPDWWDDELASNGPSRMMAEFDIARHLGLKIQDLEDTSAALTLRGVSDFRLKHSKGISPAEVQPAVVVAQRAAHLVLQCAKPMAQFAGELAAAHARKTILAANPIVDLRSLVAFCWDSGIAVIHLDPSHMPQGKKFHGMASFLEATPVVVLAFGSDSPPWLAFHLAHEIAHIFRKHVVPGGVCLVDSEIDEVDDDRQEQEANAFATELLTGDSRFEFPPCAGRLKDVAKAATELGEAHHVDPGSVALFYGRATGRWPVAQKVLELLDEKQGGQSIIAQALLERLDLEDLPESTERFLSCLSAQLV